MQTKKTNLIYLHGLDSDHNAIKAVMTDEFMASHYPHITVHRPNLNMPPEKVVELLTGLLAKHQDAVLVGSSLGGYFATLLSDMLGTPAVLLNPSISPDVSFRRFLGEHFDGEPLSDDKVIYTTEGGWQIKFGDLAWFENHRLEAKNANKIKVLLKMNDELLNAYATKEFFEERGADVLAQEGGDHRMSDYADNLPVVGAWVDELLKRD